MIIGGASPYKYESDNSFDHIDGSNPGVFLEIFERKLETSIRGDIKDRILNNDLQALVASTKAPLSSEIALKDVPVKFEFPCLLYCASNDSRLNGVRLAAGEIVNSVFVEIPDLDHLMAARNKEFVLPHIIEFMSS